MAHGPLTPCAVPTVHEPASECASAPRMVDNSPQEGRVDGSDDELVDVVMPLLHR
jgi:hypothetical protein